MSNNSVQKGLNPFDFFAIGFGAIVGVGWALSLNRWMANSGGPVPAAIGYLMVIVLLVPVLLRAHPHAPRGRRRRGLCLPGLR